MIKQLPKSRVFLEEHSHVYINIADKDNLLQRYPSVTTILSLIKNPFDSTTAIENLIKQYENFMKWINRFPLSVEEKINVLMWYVNNKNQRPYEIADWNGEPYKKYQSLKSYADPQELLEELMSYETINPRLIYVDKHINVFTKSQIDELWKKNSIIATSFGTIVHEILERHILEKQNEPKSFLTHEKFEIFKRDLELIKQEYPNCYRFDSFLEENHNGLNLYNYEEFRTHIVTEFSKVRFDYGIYAMPEKVLFFDDYKICGTSDCPVIIDDKYFDINDHKTNGEFTTHSKYDTYLKTPFDHLQECDASLYALQLNVYGLNMKRLTGLELRDLYITHYDRVKKAFIRIDLKHMQKEAQQLLELYESHLKMLKDKLFKNPYLKSLFDSVPTIYHDNICFMIDKKLKEDAAKGVKYSKEENQQRFNQIIMSFVNQQEEINKLLVRNDDGTYQPL